MTTEHLFRPSWQESSWKGGGKALLILMAGFLTEKWKKFCPLWLPVTWQHKEQFQQLNIHRGWLCPQHTDHELTHTSVFLHMHSITDERIGKTALPNALSTKGNVVTYLVGNVGRLSQK